MNGAAVRTNVNLISKNLEMTTVTGRYRSGRFDIKPAFLIGGRLIGASLHVNISTVSIAFQNLLEL